MTRRLVALFATAATVMALAVAPAAGAHDSEVIGGNTAALDATLQKGCHRYYFAYVVQVPTEDWSMEISIVDRQGNAVASFAFLGPLDPKTQTTGFTLCRASTVPGKFRIRSVLNWYDDPAEPIAAHVPVTRFRLARR